MTNSTNHEYKHLPAPAGCRVTPHMHQANWLPCSVEKMNIEQEIYSGFLLASVRITGFLAR
jgi:hypothetical protein